MENGSGAGHKAQRSLNADFRERYSGEGPAGYGVEADQKFPEKPEEGEPKP
jgi:hypothetical protein